MGCASSKAQSDGVQDLGDLAASRPTNSGHEADLTANNLEQALGMMAAYIRSRGRHIRLVVVGGVVSTMLLRTRESTQDIDFFSDQISKKDTEILRQASSHVRGQITDPRLGEGWFNNRTILFIPADIRKVLAREGVEQNAVVFEASGLTLLSAPFAYQFCSKVHRIAGGGGKLYDSSDAADYLHEYLRRQHLATIGASEIDQLLQRYRVQANERGLGSAYQDVNQAFAARYGVPAITQ